MKNVRAIIDAKGSQVWSVSSDSTVYDAIKMMSDRGVGALLVMDGGELAGIISERDYARKVILAGRSSRECAVGDVMTRDVLTVKPTHSTEDCLAIMTERRVRHLPVVEDGEIVGMLSIGDLVKAIMAEQRLLIEQLQQYIAG